MRKQRNNNIIIALVLGMSQSVIAQEPAGLTDWNAKVQASLDQRIEQKLDAEMVIVNSAQKQPGDFADYAGQDKYLSGTALTGLWLSYLQVNQ